MTLTRDVWDHYIEGQLDEERTGRGLLHAVKVPIQSFVRLLKMRGRAGTGFPGGR